MASRVDHGSDGSHKLMGQTGETCGISMNFPDILVTHNH